MGSYTAEALNPVRMHYSSGVEYGDGWHGYPGMYAGGSVTFTRNAVTDATVYFSGNISTTMYGGNTGNWYDYPITYKLFVGEVAQTQYSGTIFNYASSNYDYNTHSVSISGFFTLDNNVTDVTIVFYCNYGNVEGGCDSGTPSTTTFKLPAGELNYNPYTLPTIKSYDTITPIGTIDSSTWTATYSIEAGTGANIKEVGIDLIRNINGQDRVIQSHSFGTNTTRGTFTIKTAQYVTDGLDYNTRLYVYDDHNPQGLVQGSEWKLTRTYRTPIINTTTLSNTNFSGFGNVTLSWMTNARRWNLNPEELPFQTYIKFGTDNNWFLSTNSNPVGPNNSNETSLQTQTITKSIIDSHFSVDQRCQEVVNTNIQVRRNNPSSGVNADSNTIQISVQFAPKYKPNQINYWDYNSSSSNNRGNSINPGSICYLDEHPQIVIDWSIPNNIDRGVIDGYELYIYRDNSYTDKYKTFTVNVGDSNGLVTDLYGQKVVNIRTDLVRGQMNYVGVKAFYINPKGEKMYGPELQKQFILPVGKLCKPVISYPVNNSQWHNKNFRILFELPQDDDYDVLDEYIQNDTYEYKEIVVAINNVEYKYSGNPNIFSINKMGYKYKVCVNPSIISSFGDTDVYRITIKVQKNYFVNIWSETSNTVILNKLPVNRQNLQKDMLVLDTHYKYVQQSSIRLYNTYPINKLPVDNMDQNKGDIICAKHYQAIFDTILTIQNGVNNWARYDTGKDKCKFEQTIDKFSGTNKATTDIITAQDDERPTRKGRNYFNILIECMNKLY